MSSDGITLHPSMPLGELRYLLAEKGITDISEVAQYHYDLEQLQRQASFLSYDGYTESGSATRAAILDGSRRRECLVWCTNHYLALNRHPDVMAAAARTVAEYGTGSGTSAMSGGLSSLHKRLEKRISAKVKKAATLLFPTGFTANVGGVSALASKYDLILSDRENHASIIDGCRASRAHVLPFRHNDVRDLEQKLAKHAGEFKNVFVIVESAYSMSGDMAPLREIAGLKERYKFLLYVDEAHTFGFYGDKGAGYCAEQGVTDSVDFIMATLSKATASVGGFLALDEKYYSLLRWARPYVFQACFPPADAASILAALDVIDSHPEIVERLHQNNAYFRGRLREAGFDLGHSKSPVVPVFIPDIKALLRVTRELFERGVFTVAVTYPAVGLDEGRLRFIVSANHTREDIDETVNTLSDVARSHGLI